MAGRRKGGGRNHGSTAAHTPPGSGANFKAVEASAAKSGARNPAAVAAAVGRKKYGKAGMAALAKKGRKGR
jgi:hypothetical protein